METGKKLQKNFFEATPIPAYDGAFTDCSVGNIYAQGEQCGQLLAFHEQLQVLVETLSAMNYVMKILRKAVYFVVIASAS